MMKAREEFCKHNNDVTEFLNNLTPEQVIGIAPAPYEGFFVWYWEKEPDLSVVGKAKDD